MDKKERYEIIVAEYLAGGLTLGERHCRKGKRGILKDKLLEKRFCSFREASHPVDEAVSAYDNLRSYLSTDMLTPTEAHTRTWELKRRWKNYFSRITVSQAVV
jgi:hypothetical protein